ncbi:MAG: hypothetical protein E1N59_1585 [Puniceicoccaceae bacterium 5H]|nr:MAG: hypothetical protein E1N59_1585 [Puniceicoccaceae bacterium 5H]
MKHPLTVSLLAASLGVCSVAHGVLVRIDIENLLPANSYAHSPVFLAAHDGTFDLWDAGTTAGAEIEAIAELGDSGPATTLFNGSSAGMNGGLATTVAASSGGFGPGIYLPGAMGSVTLDLDPVMNRYLSFGAMVVPSNDAFIGNDDPMAIELFDSMGNFSFTSLTVSVGQVWDAGTEVDAPMGDGAAFINGHTATNSDPEGGMISLDPNLDAYLGSDTPAGYTVSVLPSGSEGLVRFNAVVVPEPRTYAALAGLLALGLVGWRRRR